MLDFLIDIDTKLFLLLNDLHLPLLDYFMMAFFLKRKGIFDYDWRGKVDLMLVDPFFLKDGEKICSTITHEKMFWAREDLLH